MGCSACAAKRAQAQSIRNIQSPTVDQPCSFTIETVNSWMTILQCIDSMNLLAQFNIQKALYNSFLGVIISVRNVPANICYFQKELDIIQPYIINIVNANIC